MTAPENPEIARIEMGTKSKDVTSGSEMQRLPFVSPPTWSFAVLCSLHSNTALGIRILTSTTNRVQDCVLIHQRYVLDGTAENMHQTNEM